VTRIPNISLVVPFYGCVDCVEALYERVSQALDGERWQLVLVDDASPDGSWPALAALAQRDPRVVAVRLSRNFGQHAAITAGLEQATGEWIAVMDCDLQDPPEALPAMLAMARGGFDVVLSRRNTRAQAWYRKLGARLYFRMRARLVGMAVDPEYSTLSVLSRTVVDSFLRMGDHDRHYMLILHWLGFNRTIHELEHSNRHAGRSSYTFAKLVRVALDGMFFQTTVLLRWIVYLGFVVALAGMLLAVLFGVLYFVERPLPGFTTLVVLLLLVGGFIIISTGITGLYVGKVFEQVKGRPLFVVAERVAREPGVELEPDVGRAPTTAGRA
jgi:glycosyltransferase involved in cell wall biosynthesis